MKYKLIMAVCIVTAASCKKNSSISTTATTATATMQRLILSSVSTGNGTYHFSFNTNRSLQKVSWDNGSTQKSFSYTGNIVTSVTTQNEKKVAENIYTLSNGIAQKQTTVYFDANGNSTDQYITSFKYNANGLLEKTTYLKNASGNGYAQYTYDGNKDLKELSYYNSSGALQSKSVYEYSLLLEDKSGSFAKYNTSGDTYLFPRLSKHLYTKSTVFFPLANTANNYGYTYTTDTKGYVIKQIVKDGNGIVIEEINNAWE